jgi:hypothetical protein
MIELTGFRNKQSIVLWKRLNDKNDAEYNKAISHLEYLDYTHSIKSAERIINLWFKDKEKQKYAIELNNEAVTKLHDYRVFFVKINKEIRLRIAIGQMARDKEKWIKRINESKGLIRESDIEFMTYLLEETNTFMYEGFQNTIPVRYNSSAPTSIGYNPDRSWVTIRNISEIIKKIQEDDFRRLPKLEDDSCEKAIVNLAEVYWRSGINFIYNGTVRDAILKIDEMLLDDCVFLYDKIQVWKDEAEKNVQRGYSPNFNDYMREFAQLVEDNIKKFKPGEEDFNAIQELGIT